MCSEFWSGWFDKWGARHETRPAKDMVEGMDEMLSKDVETTLGGRFFVIDVYPYSFKEFLTAKSVELSDGWEHSTVRKGEIVRAFQEYFYFGGLPEVNNFKAKRNLISSLYQKIYLGDICQRHRIGNKILQQCRFLPDKEQIEDAVVDEVIFLYRFLVGKFCNLIAHR